jgi:hypothetical protein
MKRLIIILTIAILTTASVYAQATDTSAVNKVKQEKKLQQRQMVDENADGIADNQQQKMKRHKNKKDKFIDRDGDGICDDRASGLGWRLGGKGSTRLGGQKKGPRAGQ